MELSQNVQLITLNDICLNERLSINDGVYSVTTNANETRDNEIFVPYTKWRTLKFEEAILVNGNEKKNHFYKETIGIFRIPIEIKDIFKYLKFYNCRDQSDVLSVISDNNKIFTHLQALLIKFVRTFEINDIAGIDTSIQGFYFSDAKCPTVAVDKNKKILGLHIDYSAEAHKLNIKNTVNRMSINLGEEYRDFLFVNLSINNILDMLKQHTDYDFRKGFESLDLPTLTKFFFKFFPAYPILKAKINPYEGYIAPTDNIIHDGSTLNMTGHDITLNFLGHFQLINS